VDLIPLLKQQPLLVSLNSKLKAWQMKRAVASLESRFGEALSRAGISYKTENVPALFAQRLESRGIRLEALRAKKRLRMLFLGSYEPQDRSGFVQGLHQVFDVVEMTNVQGGYGQLFSAQHKLEPATAIRLNAQSVLQAYEAALSGGEVDIVFGQMWADFLPLETLQTIARGRSLVINVAMDDRGVPALWETKQGREMGAYGLASACDLVLNTSIECCPRYLLKGCPSLFFPLASDPELFAPQAEKTIPVSFVGANYGIRTQVIKAIESKGIPVQAYGPGFPSGMIGPEAMADIFGRSKIVLGVGTCGHTRDLITMKLRDFDAPMSGAVYVTTRNPELYPFFKENEEIVFYDSPKEAADKVERYLKDEVELKRVSSAAFARCRKEHTWKQRLETTFRFLGVLKS
jgi:spore maturation protein CgeB